MKDIIVVYHSVEATCPVKISWQVGPKPKKILFTHSVETAWPGFNSTRSTGFLIDSFEVFILFNWFIWFNWLRFISFRPFPLIQMFIPLKLDQLVNSFDSFNRVFCWVSIKVHLFLKFGHPHICFITALLKTHAYCISDMFIHPNHSGNLMHPFTKYSSFVNSLSTGYGSIWLDMGFHITCPTTHLREYNPFPSIKVE